MEDDSKQSIDTAAVETLLNTWVGQTTYGEDAERLVREAVEILDSLDEAFEVRRDANPSSFEEAVFTDGRENVLYDAWMVLRAEGESLEALSEFSALITATTVYETVNIEANYRVWLLGEDRAVVDAMSADELLSE